MDPMTMCGYTTCARACAEGSAWCLVLRAPCLPEGESFVDGVKHGFHGLCGVNQVRLGPLRFEKTGQRTYHLYAARVDAFPSRGDNERVHFLVGLA